MDDELRKALGPELARDPARAPQRSQEGPVEPGELSRLVQRAIEESYHAASGGRGVLPHEAEARVAALLESYQRIQGLRRRLEDHRAQVQDELSRLRAALVSRRGFVEDLDRPVSWPVEPERWHTLRLRLQARLAAFAEAQAGDPPPTRIVAAELLELFAKERAASLADLRRQSDYEATQLERRLAALVATLEEADEVLAALRDLPHVELGLASGYREVQGLDDDARYRERKEALLQELFRRNCELQHVSPPDAGAATA
jgi:hypothetical protein